eukprot:140287_1
MDFWWACQTCLHSNSNKTIKTHKMKYYHLRSIRNPQKEQTHLRLRCHSAAYIKYLLYVSKGHIVGCNNRWLYPDASDSDMSTINRIVFYGDIVRKFKNLFYLDIKSTYYQPKFLRIRLQYVLQTDRNIRTRFEL